MLMNSAIVINITLNIILIIMILSFMRSLIRNTPVYKALIIVMAPPALPHQNIDYFQFLQSTSGSWTFNHAHAILCKFDSTQHYDIPGGC